MQTARDKSPWDSHDWKVKTVQSLVSGGGSRLAFTCRRCGRKFGYTTANHRTWAIDEEGVTLSDEVTSRWLSEYCLHHSSPSDDEDRLHLKSPR